MNRKKTFKTVGITLLGAGILLLAGTLLFLGVYALLPDRTGETHSYAAPSLPPETGKPELYPWDRMITPWEDGADTFDEDMLLEMLDPLLAPQLFPPTLHVFPYVVNWVEGEFLRDESQTMFGFRNAEILVQSYPTSIVDQYGWEEGITEVAGTLSYRFSIAFREKHGSTEICYVSLEPPPREASLPAAEEAGLAALTEWTEKRDLNLEGGSPFATFLWHFVDLGAQLECDYDSYNAAFLLYETGSCEITQEDHTVYFTFKGREGEMTLLCDPVYQTVYGISLQTSD